MSQRLMLTAMGLLTVVCIALAGLTGWLIQQQRVAAAQQQQAFAEMMERMARVAESSGRTGASAFPASTASSIHVKLTLGTPDGPPATGHTVELRQLGFDKEKSTSEQSDSTGSADFGYCDAGRYEVTIRTRWGFSSPAKRFLLHPATAHVEPIVCPAEPQEAQVSFTASLPEDLQRLNVQALVQINPGTLMHEDQIWRESFVNRGVFSRVKSRENFQRDILVRHDGWDILVTTLDAMVQRPTPSGSPRFRWIVSGQLGVASEHHILGGPRYSVRGLRLVVPDHPFRDFLGDQSTRTIQGQYEQIAPKPPTQPSGGSQREEASTHSLKLEFVAEAGKLNAWIIPIPDELIEQARRYLKDHPPPSENNE